MQISGHRAIPSDNPRAKRAPLRQPYAETTEPYVGIGPVPNVGNNMEHTWSSVDGGIVDDLSGQVIEDNHEMIDNNDFVTDQALGYAHGVNADDIITRQSQGVVTIESNNDDSSEQLENYSQDNSVNNAVDLLSIVNELSDDSYLLIISGVPVCSGPKDEIEDQARALAFGEHQLCGGEPVEIDDIIILKRIKIKVGLFLE